VTRYDSVLAKYNWAQEHIENFHTAVDLFRRENPHTLGRELDSTTGEFVYKVKTVPDIPERLRFMLGDALHNLRSTLDHAAHAVVEAGSSQPNSHTYFPVFDDAKAYISMLQSRVPGLRQQCYEVFNRIQPYKGGWGHWIWQLHRLDIIDKHRLLLTISTVKVGRTPTPSDKRTHGANRPIIGPTAQFFRQLVFGSYPAVKQLGVKAGDEIGRFPATEEYKNMGFAFDIAIDELEVITGMPTSLLLGSFSSQVLNVINDLAFFM
jgi:hypothetical protein